jgi:hypothetical protein
MQTWLRRLAPLVIAAFAVSLAVGQSSYEQHFEVRTSSIPNAGNGVFTTVAIPTGAYLGAYTGEFITDEEYLRRLKANQWQYVMGLLDCAKPHTGDITTIDGIRGNVFTRMNYAPAEFRNVKFEKICEPPFVKIVALRDISAGEELWVDYGPNYRYDFMKDEAVMRFFADLRASRARLPQETTISSRADADVLFRQVADAMPDYAEFLTVDELQQGLEALRARYPDQVRLRVVGASASGSPITECQIGRGRKHALLFGFPHPNEPIGSMMLHFLTAELAANAALRGYFDFTWHLVLCAEPDKARLNEGWFKGRNSVTRYARHHYRPPSYQQVEWTFPVSYKKYTFVTPSPEARALMAIIDEQRIDFSFGLHNSGFGGVYYYWSHDVPGLYPILYGHIARLGLPLHLGEPEVPWGTKFDGKAMFRMIYFTDQYDYLERYSPTPPEALLKSGASSDDYLRARYQSLTVNCELPYFFDARIEDSRPSDMTRREAALKSVAEQRQRIGHLRRRFTRVEPLLTAPSPFADTIRETLRTADASLAAEEKIARSDERYARQATVAEKWDALTLRRFYALLTTGQLVRLLETERARRGASLPPVLRDELAASLADFDQRAAALESELHYSVVPIRRLATVQLLTALYAMDHLQRAPAR